MRTAALLRAKVMNGVGSSIAAAAIVLAGATAPPAANATPTSSGCNLGSGIQHVIYLQFDNTHLARDDRANVPSDLEQMPHLLELLPGNGTMMANDHTVLISHTAGGILSSLTGVYPDRHGKPCRTATCAIRTGTFSFPSSFGYWTDPSSAADRPTVPNMITPRRLQRAGSVGHVHPRRLRRRRHRLCEHRARKYRHWRERRRLQGVRHGFTAMRARRRGKRRGPATRRAIAQTDFVGFAVHCAQGSAPCASGHKRPFPGEPGGYMGFKGLFGAQEIDPVVRRATADRSPRQSHH